MIQHHSLLTVALLFFAPLLVQGADDVDARIVVHGDQIIGKVNRLVFGFGTEVGRTAGFENGPNQLAFLTSGGGFWDPVAGAPVSGVLNKALAVKVGALRFTGDGSLANNLDWRETVGPIAERGDWKFGLDEYMELCRKLGAEPIITVSDYVLPAKELPALAAGLVEYLNAPATPNHPWAVKRKQWGHPEPYGVKWFELGNESDNGNFNVIPHRKYSPAQYVSYAKTTIAAMRAVDPTVKIGVVFSTVPVDGDLHSEWNKAILHEAAAAADFVIIHPYIPNTDFRSYYDASGAVKKQIPPADFVMQACMASDQQVEYFIHKYQEMIRHESGRDLPFGVTEYNMLLLGEQPETYRFSLGAALESADLVRIFLDPGSHVALANYWQFLNGYFGMVRSEMGKSDGGNIELHPAYYFFHLWAEHLGDRLVQTETSGPTATYEGWPLARVYPAIGSVVQEPHSLGTFDVNGRLDLSTVKAAHIPAALSPEGVLGFDLDHFTGKQYFSMGSFVSTSPRGTLSNYLLTFEGRYIPAPGTEFGSVGLGLVDLRGWDATQSGAGVIGVNSRNWEKYSCDLDALSTAPGVTLVGRFEPGDVTITGRFEVRNLKIEHVSKLTLPAYPLLTSISSISADKKTLHLIVFNKSAEKAISTTVSIAGFPATSARVWEVNGPSLASVADVKEVLSGGPVRLKDNLIQYSFPPHSMTAIDIK